MTTKLDKPLRRELMIGREPWVITIAPTQLKLTRKGRRKGIELEWKELIGGDAALAVALNASLRGTDKGSAERKETQAATRVQRRKPASR